MFNASSGIIKLTNSYKVLVIIITRDLSWNENINHHLLTSSFASLCALSHIRRLTPHYARKQLARYLYTADSTTITLSSTTHLISKVKHKKSYKHVCSLRQREVLEESRFGVASLKRSVNKQGFFKFDIWVNCVITFP